MIIKNAKVFTPEGLFKSGSLVFSDRIEAIILDEDDSLTDSAANGSISEDEVMDAEGMYLVPGFIDVHTHGAVGADASDGEAAGIFQMAKYYAENGVTSWCPTTMTLREPELTPAMKAIREYAESFEASDSLIGARCAGIHLEGPFLSYERRGAQNPDNLMQPDLDMVKRLDEVSGGRVKIITVAPEIEGALDFIQEASKDYCISEGHTCADYDAAAEGFRNGASHVTHLFNGMNPMLSRAPGVLVAALEHETAVELIVDGLHIHPAVIRMIYQLFPGRVNMISDSLRCTGMKDGEFDLGGQAVTLKNGKATLKGTDTLAGSTINMLKGVRNVVSFGIPLTEAVWSATAVPARELKLQDSIGSLAPGHLADFLLLDQNLDLKAVYIGGKKYK